MSPACSAAANRWIRALRGMFVPWLDGIRVQTPSVSYVQPWYGQTRQPSSTQPRLSAVPRWTHRSRNARTSPSSRTRPAARRAAAPRGAGRRARPPTDGVPEPAQRRYSRASPARSSTLSVMTPRYTPGGPGSAVCIGPERRPVPSGAGAATAGPSTPDRGHTSCRHPNPGQPGVDVPNLSKIGQALWSADARPATAFAVLAGLAVLVHRVLPTGSLPQNLVYDAVGIAAVAAIVAGVVVYRPERPQPWLLLAAGQLLFVTGDALWTILELLGESPFPSIADVAYLLGYPLLVVAFLMAIRRRVRGGDRAGLLDGAILASACALVGWVVLVRPVLDSADDPISLIVTAAYPLGDLVILGVAIGLLSTPGARTPSFVLLIASIVILFVADTAYALQVASGTYVDGGELDSLWLFSYIAMATAALHRSMRDVVAPHPVAVAWLSPTRLSLLALAMLTGPALVLMVNVRWESDVPMLAIGSAMLSLLVLWRLASVVRALARDNAARVKLEGELSYRAVARPAHGPAQPAPVRRAARRRTGPREPAAARRPVRGPRRLQDRQRQPGPRRGRRAAGRRGRPAPAAAARRRPRGAPRRRRVRDHPRRAGRRRGRAVADRLLAALDEPVEIEGREPAAAGEHRHRRRIGERRDRRRLLSDADIAMYQAKRAGKGRARRYEPGSRSLVAGPAGARVGPAPGARAERAPRHLPADRRGHDGPRDRGSRRSCAGPTRSAGSCRRRHSSRWPRRSGSSRHRRLGRPRELPRGRRVAREHRPDARAVGQRRATRARPAGLRRNRSSRRRSRRACRSTR